jgi:hypothetical protein
MRVLQFAKLSVMSVALASVVLAGCGGESTPDAPFNPAGTTADLEAMNATFASPTFNSFSTFGLMFDAAIAGSPLISASAAALEIGKSLGAERGNAQAIRAAAARSAQRLAATLKRGSGAGVSPSFQSGPTVAAIPAEVAGRTFVYDPSSGGYIASDLTGAPANGVRFIIYAVNPVTYAPAEPLTEVGHVDLTDLSGGSTQAARVQVVSGGVTYIDYTVTISESSTSGRVTVTGFVTDGTTQANITLRSTLTYTAGLTLTYSLDLPQRDVSIDLTIGISDVSQPSSPVNVNLTMRGPNGTVSMSGQFTDTTGTLNIRINGAAFATITTDGSTATIARTDGTPLSEEEFQALQRVFELQASAFTSLDLMLAPVGTFFDGAA